MTRPHRALVAQNGILGPHNPKSVTSRSVTWRCLRCFGVGEGGEGLGKGWGRAWRGVGEGLGEGLGKGWEGLGRGWGRVGEGVAFDTSKTLFSKRSLETCLPNQVMDEDICQKVGLVTVTRDLCPLLCDL